MHTAFDFGVVIGMISAALAVGIQVSTRVYQPPASVLPVARVISRVATLVTCAAALFAMVTRLAGG